MSVSFRVAVTPAISNYGQITVFPRVRVGAGGYPTLTFCDLCISGVCPSEVHVLGVLLLFYSEL